MCVAHLEHTCFLRGETHDSNIWPCTPLCESARQLDMQTVKAQTGGVATVPTSRRWPSASCWCAARRPANTCMVHEHRPKLTAMATWQSYLWAPLADRPSDPSCACRGSTASIKLEFGISLATGKFDCCTRWTSARLAFATNPCWYQCTYRLPCICTLWASVRPLAPRRAMAKLPYNSGAT